MDPRPYIEAARERRRRIAERSAVRRREAEALLPSLVQHLAERHGARRVVLFGSLAEGGFGLRSDIDLAVEGIDGARLFRAAAELDELAAPFSVDLVPLEDAVPSLVERIGACGRVLHDA